MNYLGIATIFFLSGFTSLIFQSIWIRVLSLGVGSTSSAMSIVLGIFFGGLALGSYLAGNSAKKIRVPVFFYGKVELAIGLYALALLPIFFRFHDLLAIFPVSSVSLAGTFVKFLLVSVFLLPPTIGMGASLPILIESFANSPLESGKKLSLLYGLNTLGAAVGALATGFLFIPNLGVEFTNVFASGITVLIFSGAFFLQKQFPVQASAPAEKRESIEFVQGIPLLLFVTGFSSLSAEVIWNKYLGIFLGSNIYGLSLLLSLFLLGIALGSLALHQALPLVKNLRKTFFILFFATILSFLFTSLSLNYLPILQLYAVSAISWFSSFTIKILLATIVLFPPGLFLGALFPLAIRLHSTKSDLAKETGKLYALNTFGSILGSSFTGLVLLPWLGSGYSILLATILLVLSGCYLSWQVRRLRWIYLALLILLPLLPKLQFENILRNAYPVHSAQAKMLLKNQNREEFQLIVEGKTGIISLSHDPNDGPQYKNYFRLKTNGLNESIYDRDNLDILPKYEALLGFLPFAFSRNPKSAFLVGYGGGYTVDFLTASHLEKVVVAELEAGILQAADFVYQQKNPLLLRKNLDLQIEDARYLLASKRLPKFDFIVSQPSHSWLAGVANLFTKEFFQTVQQNLKPQGVFSQWLNLYNMNPEVLKSILATFYSVFPHGYVFTSPGDQEMIMIGSMQPLALSLERLEAMARNATLSRQLTLIPFRSGYDLLAQYAASRAEILELTKGARENTDRNAYAEVTQSKLFYSQRNASPAQFLYENFSGDFQELLQGKYQSHPDFYRFLLSSLQNSVDSSYKKFPLQNKLSPLLTPVENLRLALEMEKFATALKTFETLQPKMNEQIFHLGIQLFLSRGETENARKLWQQLPRWQNVRSCFAVEMFWRTQDSRLQQAYAALASEEKSKECGPYLQKVMGTILTAEKKWSEARPYLESYYESFPYDLEAYDLLLSTYENLQDKENAKNFAEARSTMRTKERERLERLADFYSKKNLPEDAAFLRERAGKIK
jgi:spermidine synthase